MILRLGTVFSKKCTKTVFNNNMKLNQFYINKENVRHFNVPKRFEGTFVENWIKYWKNLYLDYKEVAKNIYDDCKLHPIKATVYAAIAGSCYYCVSHNPSEVAFREQLIDSSLRLLQIGEPIRNPISVFYIKWLEQCHNEGLLHRLNLGIISFIWLDDYDRACALYKTTCSYLKPRYVTFYQRIIDVGFLDNWWVLENSMINYDVNDSEELERKLAE